MEDSSIQWRALLGLRPFARNDLDFAVRRYNSSLASTLESRNDLARDIVMAPPIAELPEDWRNKIEAVRNESAEEITRYRKARENYIHAAEIFEKTLKLDTKKAHKKAAAIDIAMHETKIAMKQSRHHLEMSLARAFCDELVAACAAENPHQLMLETGHLNSTKEKSHYVLSQLENTGTQPIPGYLNRLTYLSVRSPSYDRMYDINNRPYTEPVSKSRLDAFEAAHAESSKQSLADIVNLIWTEATWPQLEAPSEPRKLPHIYSIVEELIGQRDKQRDEVSKTDTRRWEDSVSASRKSDDSISSPPTTSSR